MESMPRGIKLTETFCGHNTSTKHPKNEAALIKYEMISVLRRTLTSRTKYKIQPKLTEIQQAYKQMKRKYWCLEGFNYTI